MSTKIISFAQHYCKKFAGPRYKISQHQRDRDAGSLMYNAIRQHRPHYIVEDVIGGCEQILKILSEHDYDDPKDKDNTLRKIRFVARMALDTANELLGDQ